MDFQRLSITLVFVTCSSFLVKGQSTTNKSWEDWETKDDINVIYGLLSRPSDADNINTFNFGYDPNCHVDCCHQRCIDKEECYTVTYFDNNYPCDGGPADSIWYGECVGRTDFVDIWEPENCTYSGRRNYTVSRNDTLTTQNPPITQVLGDGCRDLNGQWSSKHSSEKINLNHNEDESLDGLYNSCSNCGWLGLEGRKATQESTLGLVVIGQGGDVVISWAGQCYVCGDEEILHLHRLTYDIDQGSDVVCDNDSSFTFTEESVFYRD